MRMLNFEIKEFVKFLIQLKLVGKESRMRTRFCRLIGERLKEIEDEREQLIEQFAVKGEDGKPAVTDDGSGRMVYMMQNAEAYNAEYSILMREEFILPETEDRIEMFRAVRDIVLNVDLEFEGDSAFAFDRWCEIVEEVQ